MLVPPRTPAPGEPVFYDATYFGESVRVGAWVRPLEQPVGTAQDVMIKDPYTVESGTPLEDVVLATFGYRGGDEVSGVGIQERSALRGGGWLAEN